MSEKTQNDLIKRIDGTNKEMRSREGRELIWRKESLYVANLDARAGGLSLEETQERKAEFCERTSTDDAA
jgi:hypothetical protein